MSTTYYHSEDLAKFGQITKYQRELGKKFFSWYNAVFEGGSLSEREKSLIGLAVAHAIQCPYCIESFTESCLEKGADEEQMMEAVHIAGAVRGGASMVHGVQMMNKIEDISM